MVLSTSQLRNITLKRASPITVEAVVRVLPNKREVVKGYWENHRIFAKVFFGKNAKKYAERDLSGVRLLSSAHIVTPELLHHGALADSQGYVLIFKAVESSGSVEALWSTLSKAAQFEMAKKLVITLAEHHNASLIQTDLYLKNFLFSDGIIYTLDGDGIRKYLPLTPKVAVFNLCTLFSKLDVLDVEAWLSDLVALYEQNRNQPVYLTIHAIKNTVCLQRKRVAKRYADQKVFRTCTDVTVVSDKNFSAVSSNFNHLNLTQDANQYDALLASHTILKAGNTCTVGLIKFKQVNVVVKRYNIKNFWHLLGRMWRPSRAAVSWANAHRLIILGIPTASPIALLELRTMGLRSKAYFLSEYVDAPDIATFFTEHHDDLLRSEVIKNVVEMFYRLFLLQVSHGDMKATNIKILNRRPLLIDLDSMRQHDFAFSALKAHVKDLRRFMRNWKEDTSLYNAFIEAFNTTYIDRSALIEANIFN